MNKISGSDSLKDFFDSIAKLKVVVTLQNFCRWAVRKVTNVITCLTRKSNNQNTNPATSSNHDDSGSANKVKFTEEKISDRKVVSGTVVSGTNAIPKAKTHNKLSSKAPACQENNPSEMSGDEIKFTQDEINKHHAKLHDLFLEEFERENNQDKFLRVWKKTKYTNDLPSGIIMSVAARPEISEQSKLYELKRKENTNFKIGSPTVFVDIVEEKNIKSGKKEFIAYASLDFLIRENFDNEDEYTINTDWTEISTAIARSVFACSAEFEDSESHLVSTIKPWPFDSCQKNEGHIKIISDSLIKLHGLFLPVR